MEIAFQFLVFRLISEDIVSATAVETCLERETKVFLLLFHALFTDIRLSNWQKR